MKGIYKYLVKEYVKAFAYGYSPILGDLVQKLFLQDTSVSILAQLPELSNRKASSERTTLDYAGRKSSLKKRHVHKTESDTNYRETTQEKVPCLEEKVEMKVEQQS